MPETAVLEEEIIKPNEFSWTFEANDNGRQVIITGDMFEDRDLFCKVRTTLQRLAHKMLGTECVVMGNPDERVVRVAFSGMSKETMNSFLREELPRFAVA